MHHRSSPAFSLSLLHRHRQPKKRWVHHQFEWTCQENANARTYAEIFRVSPKNRTPIWSRAYNLVEEASLLTKNWSYTPFSPSLLSFWPISLSKGIAHLKIENRSITAGRSFLALPREPTRVVDRDRAPKSGRQPPPGGGPRTPKATQPATLARGAAALATETNREARGTRVDSRARDSVTEQEGAAGAGE